MVTERKSITVETWDDHPLTEQVQFDCMEMLTPGVWVHHRLNMVFIITSQLVWPKSLDKPASID